MSSTPESRTSFAAATRGFAPYPAYKDSGVEWLGEIPPHWEVAALRYRYEQSLGKMLDTKQITGEHLVPYLRNIDVQWDHINAFDLPRMDIRPHEIERFTVRPGDLLVCEGGEAGRCAIWEGRADTYGYQKALHRLRPLERGRDMPRFLYYTLAAAVTRKAFADGQGSTIAHLTGDMLRAHRFPFPAIAEQQAIADHLDRETAKIDALVAKQRELTERLHEKRIALISHAVTKGLDPQTPVRDSGVEWLGKIPAHWEVRRLKNWLETNERVLPEDTHPDYAFDYLDIGSVGTGNLVASPQRVRFESAPSRARRVVGKGDTIVSTVRTYLKAVWHADGAVDHLIASTGFAVFSPGASAFPGFVNYLCQSESFTSRVTAESSGVSYPAIAESRLETLEVSVPPLPEQQAIAGHLDRETAKIDALIAKITESIDVLNEYRSALISAAVTGKIDVRGNRAETASAHPSTDETPE